jgi:hypothetical protein
MDKLQEKRQSEQQRKQARQTISLFHRLRSVATASTGTVAPVEILKSEICRYILA